MVSNSFPGTGKTSTARRMGKVYYDLGFLASAEVLECSATDLVGQYVGQTGPKTQKLFEKALGKVLFIDEAYRLATGHFAQEAMDEMVDCITKPTFANKLVVILAGYDADINRLMATNPGLTSRFPETMAFRPLKADECVDLLAGQLRGVKNKRGEGKLDVAVLDAPSPPFRAQLMRLFDVLAGLPNWANARDVKQIGKNIVGRIMRAGAPLTSSSTGLARRVSEACVVGEMEGMVRERAHRGQQHGANGRGGRHLFGGVPPPVASQAPGGSPPSRAAAGAGGAQGQKKPSSPPPPPPEKDEKVAKGREGSPGGGNEQRDAGVSDEVWEQLQRDRRAAEAKEREYEELAAKENELQKRIKSAEAEEKRESEERENQPADDAAPPRGMMDSDEQKKQERERRRFEKLAEKRKREEEEARRRAELQRRRKELEEIERRRKKMEEERKKEAKKQVCLRMMGVCCQGYVWRKQSGGYRCAGGAHWVSDGDIARYMM